MTATMDWVSHAGDGANQYQNFLVPALFAPFAEDLVKRAGLEPAARVLDLACGTGALTRAAARRAGPAGRVVGVDISAQMLAIAAEQPREADAAEIEYVERSAEDLTATRSRFDCAFCQQGLQFFSDPIRALRSLNEAVGPGGRVAVATWTAPAEATGFAALAEALDLYIDEDAGARLRQPFALADRRVLLKYVEAAGFTDIALTQHTRMVSFGPRHSFARSAVLATPVAQAFADAPAERQRMIVEHVTEAVRRCGDAHDVRFAMTTNLAIARGG
jgi:ubiquinone/menaquinone biosynthesis C-methylase UbiE